MDTGQEFVPGDSSFLFHMSGIIGCVFLAFLILVCANALWRLIKNTLLSTTILTNLNEYPVTPLGLRSVSPSFYDKEIPPVYCEVEYSESMCIVNLDAMVPPIYCRNSW
jgi:hypothetical protein